jgi:hypothetical protein
MSLKNPVTLPGIDPGIVQLVARRLNHYTTPGPLKYRNKRLKQYRYWPRGSQECSRKLRLADFVTTVEDGGKVVSLRYRPGNTPGTHFC